MNWKENIDLKTILNKHGDLEDDDQCPTVLLQELAAEVEKSSSLKMFAQEILQCETVDDLNNVLENLYEKADQSRVWCGI